jgi:hypothetical protein
MTNLDRRQRGDPGSIAEAMAELVGQLTELAHHPDASRWSTGSPERVANFRARMLLCRTSLRVARRDWRTVDPAMIQHTASLIVLSVDQLLREGRLDSSAAGLALDVGRIARRLERLAGTIPHPRPVQGIGTGGSAPGRLGTALVSIAARTLPAAYRCRYSEELLAELYDVPPRGRTLYAVRVLTRSWTHRRELRSVHAARAKRG